MVELFQDCVKTPCGHFFHSQCLQQYFLLTRQEQMRGLRSARCPLCRSSVYAPLPLEATAASGRPCELTGVPSIGEHCHLDRTYRFLSLGDFDKPGMLYLLTCNEDRKTPANSMMWKLHAQSAAQVFLNFRGDNHVSSASGWLADEAWQRCDMRSAVTSGFPNGPYSGPVFQKHFEAGDIVLRGSNCWEGTYFVFVQLLQPDTPAADGANSDAADDSPHREVSAEELEGL